MRARAARLGAVSLASQAAGAPSRSQVGAVSNPLAAAIEQRRLEALGRRRMAGHGAWSMDGHAHGAQPGAAADMHTPAQRRPDRPDDRPREPAVFVQEHVAGGEVAGSILSRTRILEAIAPARLDEIVRCIDGGWDAARCRFAPTPCTGCHRSLHVAESRVRPVRLGSRSDGFVHMPSLSCARDGTQPGGHPRAHAVGEAVHGVGALARRGVHGCFCGAV